MKKLFYFLSIILLASYSNNVMYGMKRSFEQSKRSATHYELLGVPQHATIEGIAKAFRNLCLLHNSDKNLGNEESAEAFNDISIAYNILKDDSMRQKYDSYLESEKTSSTGKPFNSSINYDSFAKPTMENSSPSVGFNAQGSSTQSDSTTNEENDFSDKSGKHFKCKFCKKAYVIQSNLDKHMHEKHPKEKLSYDKSNAFFRCGFCAKEYATQLNLNKHIDSMHAMSAGFNAQGSSTQSSSTTNNNSPFNNSNQSNAYSKPTTGNNSSSAGFNTQDSFTQSGSTTNNNSPVLNYYELLGVSPNATAEEITAGYRKLARQSHPDKNPDNEAAAEKFKNISTAYDILKNANMRQQYDSYLELGKAYCSSNPFKPLKNYNVKKCSHVFCIFQISQDTMLSCCPGCKLPTIALCQQCLDNLQIQCPHCFQNITMERNNGMVSLKQPIRLQQNTLLHDACKLGQFDTVKFLLERGAPVNFMDNAGNMPLFYACLKDYSVIAALLLKYGANVHGAHRPLLENDRWGTPLHATCSWTQGDGKFVSLLLNYGAKTDINRPDHNNVTPLQLAQRNNNNIIIQLLNEWLKK